MDWDGDTNYKTMFTTAVNTWNAYKPGVIRKDSWTVIEDVNIKDYAGDNTTILTVSSNGKIRFNQMVMDKHSDAQKTSDCLFALGLALGLGITHNTSDVMYASTSSVTTLSANDKASYDAAYTRY
ncbi:MAG: cell surface protein [Lachnospiraceae bacterium]|nr:cell surface protein [Lachnospiraceae bacterium]